MCMGFGWNAAREKTELAFHLIVTDAIGPSEYGSVRCVPGSRVRSPVHVEWRIDGRACHHTDIDVDATGLCARRVSPGTQCTVSLTDRTGYTETASVAVDIVTLPVVVEYTSTSASSERARNGTVRATVLRAPKGCLYMWTNGIVTREPFLSNASPGVYALIMMTAEHTAVLHISAAAPCRVGVVPRGISS